MLIWNASQYGGIDEINVDSSRVWVPDIVLYNRYVEEIVYDFRGKYEAFVLNYGTASVD